MRNLMFITYLIMSFITVSTLQSQQVQQEEKYNIESSDIVESENCEVCEIYEDTEDKFILISQYNLYKERDHIEIEIDIYTQQRPHLLYKPPTFFNS